MIKNLISDCVQEVKTLEENINYYESRYNTLEYIVTGKQAGPSVLEALDKSSLRNSFNDVSRLDRTSKTMNEFDHLTLAKLVGRVMDREQKWALSFENTSNKLSYKLGFDQTPWYLLFQISLYVYMALTLLG